jgi:hypothetical protein
MKKKDLITAFSKKLLITISIVISVLCFGLVSPTVTFAQGGSVPIGIFNDLRYQKVIKKRKLGRNGFNRGVEFYAVPTSKQEKLKKQQLQEKQAKKKVVSFQQRANLLRTKNKKNVFQLKNYK